MTGNDWLEGGLTPDDAVAFAKALKAAGLDYVCVSSGGITADTRPTAVASMNVQFAEKVKREAGIATRTVGLIATPKQAEAIIAEGKPTWWRSPAPFSTIPHWGWHAAQCARRGGRAAATNISAPRPRCGRGRRIGI